MFASIPRGFYHETLQCRCCRPGFGRSEKRIESIVYYRALIPSRDLTNMVILGYCSTSRRLLVKRLFDQQTAIYYLRRVPPGV
jgi:hypothetical protein